MKIIFKLNYFVAISIFVGAIFGSALGNCSGVLEEPTVQVLHPSQRSTELQNLIMQTFTHERDNSCWVFNGAKEYNMMYLKDLLLLKEVARSSQSKTVFVLDVGAGDCAWAQKKAEQVSEDPELKDRSFYFLSLAGSGKIETKVEPFKNCTIHNVGGFNIENIAQYISTLGLPSNVFDLVISRYCFIHLHDPVCTLKQTYNLTRPSTGLMLIDGAHIFVDDRPRIENNFTSCDFRASTLVLLREMGARFAIKAHPRDECTLKGTYSMIIRRGGEAACTLPWSYTQTLNSNHVNKSVAVVAYQRSKESTPVVETSRAIDKTLVSSQMWSTPEDGDAEMIELLKRIYDLQRKEQGK